MFILLVSALHAGDPPPQPEPPTAPVETPSTEEEAMMMSTEIIQTIQVSQEGLETIDVGALLNLIEAQQSSTSETHAAEATADTESETGPMLVPIQTK